MSQHHRLQGGLALPLAAVPYTPIRSLPLPPLLHLACGDASPCVAVGDHVLRGQCIAVAGDHSAALHAPSSGQIIAIAAQALLHPAGSSGPGMVLACDGADRQMERAPLPDWNQLAPLALATLLRDMGIADLPAPGACDVLIINAVADDPGHRGCEALLCERSADIGLGMAIARRLWPARDVRLAISARMPHAIHAMQAVADSHDCRIDSVAAVYPGSHPRLLAYQLTGQALPHGVAGNSLCVAVADIYAMARALIHGEPLLSRVLSVGGDAAANLELLLGTPLQALLDAEGDGVLHVDGALNGFAAGDTTAGIDKHCSGLNLQRQPPAAPPEQPCIRCGDCAGVCPVGLQPMHLLRLLRAGDQAAAEQAQLAQCIACGACDVVCPSSIALLAPLRHANAEREAALLTQQRADLARQRHQFRQFRLARDKAEKAQRMAERAAAQAAKIAPDTTAAPVVDSQKQAVIAAAMARAAAQREAAPEQTAQHAGLDDAKQAAIQAAMARAAARKAAADAAKAGVAANPAPVVDDAKQAAIDAAMARAAARKSAAMAAKADAAANAAPAVDDAKQAAIDAAMARAAARKSAAIAAKADAAANAAPAVDDTGAAAGNGEQAAPAEQTGIDAVKRAAITAALARAASSGTAPPDRMDATQRAAIDHALARAGAKKDPS